ncbi:MAG: glycosyltransferase family 4 protein [Pseudanabaena sp.]|nr:MAG: glycosyltransferase family 4 protein [Pseudanabaena sp.]
MKHIAIVTPSLSCGGAERALVLLCDGLKKNGHQVSLITIAETKKDFYKVPVGVNRIALNIAGISPTPFHVVRNNIYRLWIIRQTLRSLRPDVVISFLVETNILTLLALIQTKYPVLVSEQNNPNVGVKNVWKQLCRWVYPLARKVVSVSEGVDSYFDSWLPKKQRAVIFNPLQPIGEDLGTFDLPNGADSNKKWVISMGRLVEQKNFEMLLAAFHEIRDQHPDWQLLIFGEGEKRKELESLRDKLGLGDQVLFPGQTPNPIAVLKKSQLFVLSSRWEGLGVVLIEALACGLPVVSTDCPSGPREIIRDGVDGILVPNKDKLALANAMDLLMSNKSERERLAVCAVEAVERFSLDKITKEWELLISEVVKENLK